MKRNKNRLLAMLCVLALMVGLLPVMAIPAAAAETHTVWLVGDSTVCDYTGQDLSYYWPRNGYGMQLDKYLDGTYAVKNLALSGTSSKDFVTSDKGKVNYAQLFDAANGIKSGDTLIIGFGHNDAKPEEARYTNPNGDWQTEGSFAKSLWDNYVKPAQDKGAEVILCTPIVRRSDKNDYSGERGHNPPGSAQYPGGDYPAAIRKLGQDKSVAVVDLTGMTKALYTELGASGTLALHAQQGKDVPDNTHLNVYGAEVVAQLLAKGIKGTSTALAAHVDDAKFTPDKAHVTIGPEYKEPVPGEYPTTDSVLGDPYNVYNVAGDVVVTFKPTAFGALGGTPSQKNEEQWKFETDADGNMHMVAGKNKGKVNSTQDGLMMYWCAVPADKQFTLTAKAKLNSFDTNAQVSFGLMARDDMRIDARDCYTDGSYPNYVAAGTLGNSSTNCFYRKDGKLTTTKPLSTPLEAGKEYQLSIKSNSDGYACQFGDEPAQSQGFDFSLLGVDKNYVYVGMFTARNVDVTFSDISLVITDASTTPDDPNAPTLPGAVAGGGLETLFAEVPDVADADVTAVKWTGAATGELKGDDLTYLVRDAQGGVRVDVPGLKAGKYDLTLTVKGQDYTAKGIEVKAHDRSGFAHQSVAADSTCTPYTEGVGAYNDDGTIKENATVIYVTDENKDTVTLTVGDKSLSGIGNILNTSGYKTNGANGGEAPKILMELSRANKPLVIRVLGEVNAPKGVSPKAGKSNGSMCYMKYAKDVTIEGVGPDATIKGWGVSFSGDAADANNDNWGKNFEVRNLAFKEVPEDCVEITGNANGDGSIKEPVSHAWVHNCAFYRPTDIADPAEADKAQGDGSVDFKSGQCMTMSYNYFERNHKTSLIGGGDSHQQYHVTWHHNYWKNVESRAPLARQADMHIYNNLYEGQSSYCMSLRANTYIYSEYNTFLDCVNPFVNEKSGGVAKSYQDVFTNCSYRQSTNTTANDKVEQHATIVTDKTQTVTSANKFANFDTAAGSYVAKGDYKLDATVAAAQANIKSWGGVMKAAADMTTVPLKADGQTGPVTPDEPVVKDALNTAITNAEKTIDVYTVEDDTKASEVNSGVKFVTKTDKANYQKAIDAAKAVAANTAATQAEVDKAVADLAVATTAFNKAVKRGTKGSGNTSSSSSRGEGRGEQPTPPAAFPFTDVAENDWFYAPVKAIFEKGLMKGVDASHFDPAANTSRAMVATILYRLDGEHKGDVKAAFQDVADGTWYTEAVAWAADKGVVKGYDDTTFAPDDAVTREQLAVMLFRYADPTILDKSDALGAFTDATSVSDWAVQAMQWAVKAGILNGKGNGILDPQGIASRAEVCAMLQRYVDLEK